MLNVFVCFFCLFEMENFSTLDIEIITYNTINELSETLLLKELF